MNKLGVVIAILGFIGLFWFGTVYAFMNPELTQTQVLIARWPHMLASLAGSAVGFGLMGKRR